jgi:hypothetical protein
VDRKLVKQTVMTSVYGVTFVGARAQVSTLSSSQSCFWHALQPPPSILACSCDLHLHMHPPHAVPALLPSCVQSPNPPTHPPTPPNHSTRPPASRSRPQIGNRLKERGFEDNQFLYKVSCYSAKVSESASGAKVEFYSIVLVLLWEGNGCPGEDE